MDEKDKEGSKQTSPETTGSEPVSKVGETSGSEGVPPTSETIGTDFEGTDS